MVDNHSGEDYKGGARTHRYRSKRGMFLDEKNFELQDLLGYFKKKDQSDEYSQILLKLIMLHVTKVQDQNKKYFENRALELIHKDKKDRLATVQLNIIMKSLKVTRGELLLK